jgi:hypothetical protein
MRSGTTLLQQMLCTSPAANPSIHGCRYLVSQVALYAQYAGSDRLYIDGYLGGAQELFDFTKDLLNRLLQETHARLGRPATLVLKSPELSIHFPHAAALFPEARFVISVRDAKDTIASMIRVGEKHRQRGVNSFLAAAVAGRNLHALCMSYRQFYLPVVQAISEERGDLRSRVFFVRYDDLIGDTHTTARRLSEFSGLSLEPAALGDSAARRTLINRETDPLFKHPRWSAYVTDLSGGPISSASIGRYHDVLTAAEAQKVDELCQDIDQLLRPELVMQRP